LTRATCRETGSYSREKPPAASACRRPLLLSCKACPVKTEAVNELAVLRDRFGGQMAAAAVVTTYPCRAVTRRRAMELGMDIIDRTDLSEGRLLSRLKALSSVSQRR